MLKKYHGFFFGKNNFWELKRCSFGSRDSSVSTDTFLLNKISKNEKYFKES